MRKRRVRLAACVPERMITRLRDKVFYDLWVTTKGGAGDGTSGTISAKILTRSVDLPAVSNRAAVLAAVIVADTAAAVSAAVVIAGAAIATRSAFLPWLGAIAALTSGAIGVYHTGVERAWWPGPTSCTSSAPVTGISADDLLNQIMSAEIHRCDEVIWQLMGLSMASWNAIASVVLAAIWVAAARKSHG